MIKYKYIKKFEDVGDKYAEKRFNIPLNFSNFEKDYKIFKNKEEIISGTEYFSEMTIIKNPKSLEYVHPEARGIINKEGDLFIEKEGKYIHNAIIDFLYKKGYIKGTDKSWHLNLPINFITIQRYHNTNNIYLGESNEILYSDKRKELEKDRYEHLPKREIIKKEFQKFLDKAKIKNPKYNFHNKLIS